MRSTLVFATSKHSFALFGVYNDNFYLRAKTTVKCVGLTAVGQQIGGEVITQMPTSLTY